MKMKNKNTKIRPLGKGRTAASRKTAHSVFSIIQFDSYVCSNVPAGDPDKQEHLQRSIWPDEGDQS